MPQLPRAIDASGDYLIATIHRADNTDDRERLAAIVSALRSLSVPVALLAHPRLVSRAAEFGIELTGDNLHTTTPLAYPQMVRAVMSSVGVVTDSGGLQKEAYLLGAPCTTIRPETEWVETVDAGWNVLVGADEEAIARELDREISLPEKPELYGDGDAADDRLRRHPEEDLPTDLLDGQRH